MANMEQQKIDLEREKIRPLLEKENINPNSFLATDYLNHFNEVFMLLEMTPDMPDMLEDVLEWKPKSYVEHFRDSGLHAKHLIIEAYHLCPDHYRLNFDRLVSRLDYLLLDTIEAAHIARQKENLSQMTEIIQSRTIKVQELISSISAVINDTSDANQQTDIDDLFDEDLELFSDHKNLSQN